MRRIPSLIGAVILLLIISTTCDSPLGIRSNSATGNKSLLASKGGGGGGGEVEVVGNNLSFPVIWADGVTKALRGTYLTEVFGGESFMKNDSTWYVQADPLNTWQAESYNPLTELNPEHVVVSTIDWGDNLEAKSWAFGSQVRVETVLYKKITNRPMTAYRMIIYDEAVSGLDEVWGTNGMKYMSREATVYSATARLVIQKLTKTRDDNTLSLSWDPATSRWIGDAMDPVVTSGVWNNLSGPANYSAEINVQGKVIYGYNWVTRRDGDGDGDYRITFVLEPEAPGITCNTLFDATTNILISEEEEEPETVLESESEPVSTGGVAEIDVSNNLTYIDVRLTANNGGGKGSGNSGGGKSGQGGGGRHH